MNDFGVIKTTTDKLQEELNRLAEFKAEVVQTQYVGGRDWVIIHGQSEMDPWNPSNWEAGKPGVFQPWMCGVWPVYEDADKPRTPCLYQRDHSGRHHFEPHETYDLPIAIPKDRHPNAEEFLRDKLRVWDITLAEPSPGVPFIELLSTWMEEWHAMEITPPMNDAARNIKLSNV